MDTPMCYFVVPVMERRGYGGYPRESVRPFPLVATVTWLDHYYPMVTTHPLINYNY